MASYPASQTMKGCERERERERQRETERNREKQSGNQSNYCFSVIFIVAGQKREIVKTPPYYLF
jgi:hypothetical protein